MIRIELGNQIPGSLPQPLAIEMQFPLKAGPQKQ